MKSKTITMLDIQRATLAARKRSGRMVAIVVDQGKARVVDWTGVKMNGKNDGKPLTGWVSVSEAVTAMDATI